jgi:putative endonuclease
LKYAMKTYAVYILANATRMLYIGVTNNLDRRIWEHKNKLIPGFASRYQLDSLVYFEPFSDVKAAIAREKELKGWLRGKKVALINSANPSWTDLAATHFHKLRTPPNANSTNLTIKIASQNKNNLSS